MGLLLGFSFSGRVGWGRGGKVGGGEEDVICFGVVLWEGLDEG